MLKKKVKSWFSFSLKLDSSTEQKSNLFENNSSFVFCMLFCCSCFFFFFLFLFYFYCSDTFCYFPPSQFLWHLISENVTNTAGFLSLRHSFSSLLLSRHESLTVLGCIKSSTVPKYRVQCNYWHTTRLDGADCIPSWLSLSHAKCPPHAPVAWPWCHWWCHLQGLHPEKDSNWQLDRLDLGAGPLACQAALGHPWVLQVSDRYLTLWHRPGHRCLRSGGPATEHHATGMINMTENLSWVVKVVAFSSLARLLGECSIIHSLHAL